ncbi:MAG: hypothetical protein ACEY3L_15085 [Wolbachia sp.]|nr:hypothetical protein [Wolbachia endosymbiont (group A) of Tiphia femorata]
MSVATRFFRLLCNKAIPASRAGMTGGNARSLLIVKTITLQNINC